MSNAAKIQMMEMTTSNSMRVKPRGEVEGRILLPALNGTCDQSGLCHICKVKPDGRAPWQREYGWAGRWGNLVMGGVLLRAKDNAVRHALKL
jgi:hypothetical protein